MQDHSGTLWILIDIAAVMALGAAVAWAAHESLEYRRHRRLPTNARAATPKEAERSRAISQGRELSSSAYLFRIATPIAAALLLSLYLCFQLI